MATNQPNEARKWLNTKQELPAFCDVAAMLSKDSRYAVHLEDLPPRANPGAICRYLATLSETNADAGIIIYSDDNGSRKIASYDKRGAGLSEESIDIQSTTKAIFSLYLAHLLKGELWENIDHPIASMLPNNTLVRMRVAEEFDPKLRGRALEEKWEQCTLRQLLNHTSGIAFNEECLVAEGAPKLSSRYTRYSNVAVELGSIVAQQWLRNKFENSSFLLHESGNSFLKQNFVAPFVEADSTIASPMTFSLYENLRTGFSHMIASGKAHGTASQVAALPVVVKALGVGHIEKLFTPISDHQQNLMSGIGTYRELQGSETYWGSDLNPETIANLFFLRSYGYATRGSFENNCDVVVQDYCASSGSAALATSILNNPYFTVVRLQRASSVSESVGPSPDHGAQLQHLLGSFFNPSEQAQG